MGEVTPTPWWIAGKKTIRYGVKNPRTLQEGGWVADCTWNNGEANARRIVTAVNAHDDLVAALKECAALLRELCPRIPHDGPRNEEERIQYETIGGTFSHAERVISKATCS